MTRRLWLLGRVVDVISGMLLILFLIYMFTEVMV